MLILFDIDDTLLDHEHAMRLAATALHSSVGHAGPLEDFLAAWNTSHRQNFSRYLTGELTYEQQRRTRVRETVDRSYSDDQADRAFAHYVAAYEAHWSLYPDALSCLDQLAGHRLGVISNGQSEQQRRKLVQMGILERFDVVLISEECGFPKPAPEIFLRACAALDGSPQNAIYIGDLYDVDAQGARQAGLVGIWLDRRNQASQEHLAPIIKTLCELPALLDDVPRLRRNR